VKFSCAAGVLACLFLSGCGLFSPKPVLPKHAAADGEVDRADEFVAALQHADIIYVPVEAIGLSSAEQSAWKILEAFRRSGNSFAIAWTGVACDQQPLLDELTVKRDHVEAYLAQVRWNYTGRMCEQCKAILRANAGIHQVALGRPRIVYEKLQSGEALTPSKGPLFRAGSVPRLVVWRSSPSNSIQQEICANAKSRTYIAPIFSRNNLPRKKSSPSCASSAIRNFSSSRAGAI